MARKPFIVATEKREARERNYRAAPVVGSYRAVDEVTIEMSFFDPEGKLRPSSQRRVYANDMQAFFDFLCPLHDCNGGGFDAGPGVHAALSKRGADRTGKLTCHGARPRNKSKDQPCNLELTYRVLVREKDSIAA